MGSHRSREVLGTPCCTCGGRVKGKASGNKDTRAHESWRGVLAYVLRGYRGDVGDALSRAVSGNRVATHHEDGRQCKEPHARYGERKGGVRLTSGSAHVSAAVASPPLGRGPRGLKSTPPPLYTWRHWLGGLLRLAEAPGLTTQLACSLLASFPVRLAGCAVVPSTAVNCRM